MPMTSSGKSHDLEILYNELIPALSKAAVGEFDSTIKLDPTVSPQAAEIMTGVQVLLSVIQDKIAELKAANAELEEARDRSVTILADVLDKSVIRS
jgi:hypothetical protein